MKDNRSKELKILGIQPKETKRFLGIEKTTTNYHIGDDVTVRADGKLNKKTVIESASETNYKITPKFWIGLGLFVLAAAIATVLVLSGPAAVITLPLLVKASTVLTGLMAKTFAGISTAAVAIFGKGAAFTVGSAVTAWVTPFVTAVASLLSVGILTGLAIGVVALGEWIGDKVAEYRQGKTDDQSSTDDEFSQEFRDEYQPKGQFSTELLISQTDTERHTVEVTVGDNPEAYETVTTIERQASDAEQDGGKTSICVTL